MRNKIKFIRDSFKKNLQHFLNRYKKDNEIVNKAYAKQFPVIYHLHLLPTVQVLSGVFMWYHSKFYCISRMKVDKAVADFIYIFRMELKWSLWERDLFANLHLHADFLLIGIIIYISSALLTFFIAFYVISKEKPLLEYSFLQVVKHGFKLIIVVAIGLIGIFLLNSEFLYPLLLEIIEVLKRSF